MLAQELIEYIVQENKIIELLTKIGCKEIFTKNSQKDIRCALPNGDNATSVSVMKNNLYVNIYSKGIKGNIYTLVCYIYNLQFIDSLKKVHALLGLDYYGYSHLSHNDPLRIYKKALGSTYYNSQSKEGYDMCYLEQFINIPHKSWLISGITQSSWDRFYLRYDNIRSAVIIPWLEFDPSKKPIAGIVRRTTIPNAEDFGIPKYICENNFLKGNHLFGLVQNYQYILQKGYVVVFESERATIQRSSRFDYTCVSIGSHELKEKQRQLLVSLGVEIIIAFDKDIKEDFLKLTCEQFYGVRKISYILDTENLLDEKDSPADKNNEIYNYLLNHRKEYIKQCNI